MGGIVGLSLCNQAPQDMLDLNPHKPGVVFCPSNTEAVANREEGGVQLVALGASSDERVLESPIGAFASRS